MTAEKPSMWAVQRALALMNSDPGIMTTHQAWKNAFARYIEAHETAPVAEDLRIAREAAAQWSEQRGFAAHAARYRSGEWDHLPKITVARAALAIAAEKIT